MVVDELIESLYREVSVMDHEESFFCIDFQCLRLVKALLQHQSLKICFPTYLHR
jgi:hypothetical protein